MTFDDLFKKHEIENEGRRDNTTTVAIKDNFILMLKKKPIESISVGALCEKCCINRSTFYRHFSDIYDLLEAVTKDSHRSLFYDILQSVDLSDKFDEVGYQYILKVCEVTEARKDLYQLLLFGKTSTALRQLMEESAYKLYVSAHDGPTALRPDKNIGLHYKFLVCGIVGLWTSWLRDDCRTPKEAVAAATRQEISGFYLTMSQLYGKKYVEVLGC